MHGKQASVLTANKKAYDDWLDELLSQHVDDKLRLSICCTSMLQPNHAL
jgi:hypothetical protein